jgi:hypothetical protein
MTPEISDEWVPISEDTPSIARGYKNVSRDVVVLSEVGAFEAYYDYRRGAWRDSNSRIVKVNIIAWRDK